MLMNVFVFSSLRERVHIRRSDGAERGRALVSTVGQRTALHSLMRLYINLKRH